MNSKFAKAQKYIVVAFFLIAVILSVMMIGKVSINYNISDYLDEKTNTKISLGIIEKEFGMTGDIQVMVEDISVDDAKGIVNTLKGIDNVLTVNFDEKDEGYYKDKNALFVVIVDGDEYSDVANTVVEDIKTSLNDTFGGKINYGGAVMEKANLRKAMLEEIPFILAISVCLTIAIMLLTSKSWIEPFILLFASGIAIIINLGTNIIFSEISYITNAVAAILQLALSIDYSIVLLHEYRKLKETEECKSKAMTIAIKNVIKPVSASALTTIAGLLALLFMSMRIGFDIGIVLMKGIVISVVVSLTLLPTLLIFFENLLNKTQKREFVLKGKSFCEMSFKASKVIVPIALVIIIACSVLQFRNTYSFTDSKNSNSAITDTFGNDNTVVVVYPNSDDNLAKETKFAEKLSSYKTSDGKTVLKNYTAYSNTVKENSNIELISNKLNIPTKDVEFLFAMYHLYNDNSLVKITPLDFIKYTNELITNDADAKELSNEDMSKVIDTMLAVNEIMNGKHTATQFHTLATTGALEGINISLFSIKQMYGLYLYNSINNESVDFETMLDFMITASSNQNVSGLFDARIRSDLASLSNGIKQFNAQMEAPLTKKEFQGYMYQTYGIAIDEATASQIYAGYYLTQGKQAQSTIPFLKLMTFLVNQGKISSPAAIKTLNDYNTLYSTINAQYSYDQFLSKLSQIATSLSGTAPSINTTSFAVQQIYIMYFYEQNAIPNSTVLGRTFIDFVISKMNSNTIVKAQISNDGESKLSDMCAADDFLNDTNVYDFKEMTAKINETQNKIKSISTKSSFVENKISSVYIKYGAANNKDLTKAVEANELLNFVANNMDTHELLKAKISDDNRSDIKEAQSVMEKATDLFVGDNYSRMLLSIDLANESEESSAFISYLLDLVKEFFGEDAHIAGTIASTYDLQNTFDDDNKLISIFTLISIFAIVMIIFRSLSLPIILVTVIQGAIWIAMSTSLLTGPMFFMSYIVATCILMGATIDYGILMSSNYIQHRSTLDKKEALYRSVEAAMPTVFTSGLILTICGFVVGFISSQTSISTVGMLLGKGTLVSVIMITFVLPSILYLLDGFILKLSIKKKAK